MICTLLNFLHLSYHKSTPPRSRIEPVTPPLPPCCLIKDKNRTSPPPYPKGERSYIHNSISKTIPIIHPHLPSQGNEPVPPLLSHHAALSTTPTGPPLPITPRGRGHTYCTQFLYFNINITLHLPHQGSNLCLLSHTLPYQLHQPDLPFPLPQGGEVICTVLNFFCLYPT